MSWLVYNCWSKAANGCDVSVFVWQESNGPSDAYAAISTADRLQAEPESLRKWREEQRERLEVLGTSHFRSRSSTTVILSPLTHPTPLLLKPRPKHLFIVAPWS